MTLHPKLHWWLSSNATRTPPLLEKDPLTLFSKGLVCKPTLKYKQEALSHSWGRPNGLYFSIGSNYLLSFPFFWDFTVGGAHPVLDSFPFHCRKIDTNIFPMRLSSTDMSKAKSFEIENFFQAFMGTSIWVFFGSPFLLSNTKPTLENPLLWLVRLWSLVLTSKSSQRFFPCVILYCDTLDLLIFGDISCFYHTSDPTPLSLL